MTEGALSPTDPLLAILLGAGVLSAEQAQELARWSPRLGELEPVPIDDPLALDGALRAALAPITSEMRETEIDALEIYLSNRAAGAILLGGEWIEIIYGTYPPPRADELLVPVDGSIEIAPTRVRLANGRERAVASMRELCIGPVTAFVVLSLAKEKNGDTA